MATHSLIATGSDGVGFGCLDQHTESLDDTARATTGGSTTPCRPRRRRAVLGALVVLVSLASTGCSTLAPSEPRAALSPAQALDPALRMQNRSRGALGATSWTREGPSEEGCFSGSGRQFGVQYSIVDRGPGFADADAAVRALTALWRSLGLRTHLLRAGDQQQLSAVGGRIGTIVFTVDAAHSSLDSDSRCARTPAPSASAAA